MHKIIESKVAIFDEPAFTEGLDNLGIGMFLLDQDGYLIESNEAAARIFGIDSQYQWEEKHISHLDDILKTGLADKYSSIINEDSVFQRDNISCTNNHGIYMVLNVYCHRYFNESNKRSYVMGMIEDTERQKPPCTDPRYYLEELEIFSTIASALSSSNDLDRILKVILTGATASQGLGFNRAFLFLHEQEGQDYLRGYMAVGPTSAEEAGQIWQKLENMRMSLSELLDSDQIYNKDYNEISQLINNFKIDFDTPSIIKDACLAGNWLNLEKYEIIDEVTQQLIDRLKTKKLALVPLVSKGHLMGLLVADNYITSKAISDSSIQLLQVFANQAAVAMERAGLYEEQKRRNKQLEKMNQLLAESQEHIIRIEKMSVIGELTSSIAHELRNPLTIIGGFAGLMLKSQINDEQREYLNIIASETKRAESVLNHVLDFSKASKSDNKIIDFYRLVDKNLKLLLGRLKRSNVTIKLYPPEYPTMVYGNYDQISHAIYQFLKLVAEEFIPTASAVVKIEKRDKKAVMSINIIADEHLREQTVKALKQIFTENKTSQRLTILVAGEALRFHGGNFGLSSNMEQVPTLYIELPLHKEDDNGSSDINN